MPKIKDDLYRNIHVSISEFVLIAMGVFKLKYLHIYSKVDLDYILNWVTLINIKADLELLSKMFIEGDEPPLKSSHSLGYRTYKKMRESRPLLTKGFQSDNNKFIASEILGIVQIKSILNTIKKHHKDIFPASIEGERSSIENSKDTYNFSELVKCLYQNTDVKDIIFIPLIQSMFDDMDEKNGIKKEPTMEKNSSLLKETLSPMLQFVIECSTEPTFQHSHINNKGEQLTKFKEETVSSIIALSKKKKVEGVKSKTITIGLSKTKCEHIFDIIQKN